MAMKRSVNSKKGSRKCTHCNGTNHTVDTCFKIHSYPEWHTKGKKEKVLKDNSTTAAGFVAKSEVQNHVMFNQDIRLFDVVPTTMKYEIQNNGNENVTEDDSIISSPTSEPLAIQSSDNSIEISPEPNAFIHSIADTQNHVSGDIQSIASTSSQLNSDPIVSPYTLPPRSNRGEPPTRD
ncbi:Retrovirus-related Pol polyprotein from transposon TNT 1-94 [Sesbania bispinosa]|nr:Retrovirus-related Pol polyprotein from transposon TNT 1-94 [Sesbania bispinosa]